MILLRKSLRKYCTAVLLIIFLISTHLTAQDAAPAGESQGEDLVDFMEDGMKEIDFYSLEELLDVEVEVASLFEEDELVVGSSVSSISSHQWKMQGAKKIHEAFDNETSFLAYPSIIAGYPISIRGYTGNGKGVAIIIDGVPLNELTTGTSYYYNPNWILGTLDRIEMIKGPGSAIYGSDAFHGVISLKSFESDKDHYEIEGAGAWPLYGDANLKISQGFGSDLLRIDMTAGASYQDDQDLEYEYNDPQGLQDNLFLPDLDPESGISTRKYEYNTQSGLIKLSLKPTNKIAFKIGTYFNRGEFRDFPAARIISLPDASNTEVHSRDNDVSDGNTEFLLTRGEAVYFFPNKISIEASGYYWKGKREAFVPGGPRDWDLEYDMEETVNRTGLGFIIKQPENPAGLQWLFAYSYSQMAVEGYETASYNNVTIISRQPTDVDGASRNIHSGFGQFKWGIMDKRLFALLGIRDDYYSDFGNQITPRGGLIFLPSQKSSIKTLYGRAFRAPAVSEQKDFTSFTKGDPDLKPEIIDIYEFIYIYKEKKWKTSINLFYSYWKNGIILVEAPEDPNFSIKYTNKGKNDSIGGELEAFYSTDPFAIDLGFSYVRSRALDIKAPEDPSRTVDRVYGSSPEYSINAGIYYTLKGLDINFYLNNIIRLNMREAPDSVRPLPNSLPQYYRMDLNISRIVTGEVELYCNVKNILNRENYVPSIYGTINGYVEPGTSVMLRAGYKL